MSLRAWFHPPRHWLGLFLLITLAPSSLLIWFGWRSLRQDRALALQQVQERRDQAADLIVAGLEQSLRFALEEYKAGRITKAELRRLLGFETRYELDGFLKAHQVWANVTIEDLRRDVQDLKSLGL
jgi:Uncharacterised protein family (UPF0175)